MKIAVIGAGYVGFSNAIVLAQQHNVTLVDVDKTRVDRINNNTLTLGESDIESFVQGRHLNLQATSDINAATTSVSYVLIATPTDYNEETGTFDTSSVESCIASVVGQNPTATIVVKSTVPVGFTATMCDRHHTRNIIFSPEFLREGHSLHDCLNPTRIVIGGEHQKAAAFAHLYAALCNTPSTPILLTGTREAEAIKLFANSYLALRVAYFNEIDTYSITQGLSSRDIIDGVCLDPRIGSHYNNPSFGYGGYCLPKDTKQLLANYSGTPQNLISAIVDANDTRMDVISADIIRLRPTIVGIYKLAMKSGSDNFRSSAIFGIIDRLVAANLRVIVFEPTASEDLLPGCTLIADIGDFKQLSDLIIANRHSPELTDVSSKVYTRDLFHRD